MQERLLETQPPATRLDIGITQKGVEKKSEIDRELIGWLLKAYKGS